MLEKLKTKWQELQPRERVLLTFMICVFFGLGIFIVSVMVTRSFDARAAEIQQYRDALYYLEDNQGDYVSDKKAKDALKEKLVNNDFKANTLAEMGSTLGFDVNVNPKDWRKASTTSMGCARPLWKISRTRSRAWSSESGSRSRSESSTSSAKTTIGR